MYAVFRFNTLDLISQIHSFLEHTNPKYTLYYTVLFMVAGTMEVKLYIGIEWDMLYPVIAELLDLSDTGEIDVIVVSGEYSGGYIGYHELPDSLTDEL